ncbi:hypothetical protein GCK32_011508 [Trichostrongylus colubriformis]|uniref:Uncharacterized protein n=1 Tax=Trichostrongylus colubriformis TaxID=6319 RepID=A0AAN8IEM0_TRICO
MQVLKRGVIAALSLIVCFVGSFALVSRTIRHEIEAGPARVTLYDILDNIIYISIDYRVIPEHKNPKLCSAKFAVTIPLLDERKKELQDAIIIDYLCGSNDAVTRCTSMLLVMAGFACMFQVWLVAFVKSTIRRPSSIIANRRALCILVADRHTQLVSFLLPMSIVACILLEIIVLRFRRIAILY